MSAEPTSPPFFTEAQRRIIGFTLTLAALLGSGALIIAAFIVFGRLVGFFSSVLWPLAVAAVLALILRPLVDFLGRRLKLRRTAAVVLIYGIVVLLLGGALLLLIPPLADQLLDFITYLPTLWTDAHAYIAEHYPQWIALARRQLANPTIHRVVDAVATEGQAMLSQTLPTLRSAGGSLLGLGAFATHLLIIPVYLFFFLLSDGDPTRNLHRQLPFLKPSVGDDLVFLLREFIGIVESFFRGQLIIGLIMGALLALGFTLIGLKFGLAIGLLVGVLNIVPYLGSIIGLAVTLPLAFFQPDGGWKLVGLVLLVKLIVQTIEGWVLTPKIMGERTGLHPVTIIVAIFFWGTAFDGILGMLLAIPLTAFFVTAWRLAKRKYLKPAS